METSRKYDFRSTAAEKLHKAWISFFDSIQVIITALCFVVIAGLFISPTAVSGSSMHPTFESGSLLILDKFTTSFGSIRRGDIVAFHYNTEKNLIKRVIGIPGEQILIKDSKIFINNKAINETYLSEDNKQFNTGNLFPNNTPLVLKNDEYFLMGDNRNNSLDSRVFGPISKNQFIGKATYMIWPFKELHSINSIEYPELENK